jgi:hypothetical protein
MIMRIVDMSGGSINGTTSRDRQGNSMEMCLMLYPCVTVQLEVILANTSQMGSCGTKICWFKEIATSYTSVMQMFSTLPIGLIKPSNITIRL